MMKHMTMALGLIAGTFGYVGSVRSGPIVYDLAADWSDTTNPNGPWSYNFGPGEPITTHQSNWFGSSPAQPAWAFGPEGSGVGKVPLWAKSVGANLNGVVPGGIDFPTGRVGGHGSDVSATNPNSPASVSWTSPIDALVDVSGGTWLMRKFGRSMNWEILLNNSPISGGTLASGDPYTSSHTFDLANGSGGPGALSFALHQGDTIAFQIERPPGSDTAEFVGIDLTIVATPTAVPEPATFILLGMSGPIVLGFFAWSRRTLVLGKSA